LLRALSNLVLNVSSDRSCPLFKGEMGKRAEI